MMNFKHIFKPLFFFLLGISAIKAQAQVADSSQAVNLELLTVTATRLPSTVETTGRNITVITREQISAMPANSVDEVLRTLPGLEVQSRGAFGAQSDFVIRGGTFAQTLVLIDGMRLNDPLTGHFNSYIPVAISEIERIEVLRGAASSAYGPDAVGGVIHIITKNFDLPNRPDSSTSALAKLSVGDYGLLSANAGFSSQLGKKFSLSGGLTINKADGHTLRNGGRGFVDNHTYSMSAKFKLPKQWSLSGKVAFDQRYFSAQNFYTISTADKATEKTTAFWPQLRLAKATQNGTLQTDIAYKYSVDDYKFNATTSANQHYMHFVNAQVVRNYFLNDKFSVSAGLQSDYRQIASNDRGNHSDYHVGVFGLVNYNASKQLTLSGGLRTDYDQNYGFEPLPQLNVAYHYQRLVFRGSTGRSIRAADYTERYSNFNRPSVLPLRNIGNPNLKAEQSWSHEAGIDIKLAKGFELRNTAFYRLGNRLIDYTLTNSDYITNNNNLIADTNYLWAQNLDEVRTYGFENELIFNRELYKDLRLSGWISYAQLTAENNKGVISKYLSNHANNLITFGLLINHKRLTAGVNGLWKSRAPQLASTLNAELAETYQVVNIRLGYRFFAEKLEVNAQVNNIADKKYSDILGAEMPGRWLQAGIAYQFNTKGY